MSDNELDNLFKEAAEGFKVPHDPSAWKEMSGKLDHDGPSGAFWNWKSGSITSALIIGGLALVWYWNGSAENEITALQTSIESVNEAEDKSDSNADKATSSAQPEHGEKGVGKPEVKILSGSETDNSTNRSVKSFEATTDFKKPSDMRSSDQQQAKELNNKTNQKIQSEKSSQYTVAGNSGGKTANQNSNPKIISATDVEAVKSVETGNKLYQEGLTAGEIAITQYGQSDPTQIKSTDVKPLTSDDKVSPTSESSNKTQALPELSATDSLNKVDEDKMVANDSAQAKSKKKKNKEDRVKSTKILSIKLAVAPDYTSVEDVSPNGWGISYGMLLEYQFRPHWSVATGAIWSKKIYSAEDVKYNGYTADWVDGDCRMWDIPVNVYYHFTPGKKLSFYGGVGLSSYLMSEENYTFYYETSYGLYDYDRQVKGENNEWFKTLNISLGMQYRINNRFSLQLEPILKAPLAGVGEGEVSLVSLGAFFNLRYNFLIKNVTDQ